MPRLFLIAILLSLLLAACADSAQPEDAVLPYLEALLNSDDDAYYQYVCPEWEAEAKRDFDAFTGVSGKLHDAQCTQVGTEDDMTLVTCTGTMELNYNGELRTRDLASQTYYVTKSGGEWKVCGYQ
ncbi:MAG: hypothetical protein JXA10_05175 [Anaerolineae bacterium]|nr:hypothetical protein [Anaerolineae bacterium]